MRIWTWIFLSNYGIELIAHYTFGYHPEWTDGNMICTGLLLIGVILSINNKGAE